MPKILPKVFIIFFALLIFLFSPLRAFAQSPSPTPTPPEGQWVEDAEVTFVGKTGVRAGDFLDWTLRNYSWLCVEKISENQCNNADNPLISFWIIIRNIVYALLALFVLATAFIIIVTRGQNITVMRFIPRFVFIIVLITLSFSLVQFIYQVGDIIQDFFLKIKLPDGTTQYITTKNLLFIGFDYSFRGYRVAGPEFAESAFISLLLVRLTAITYYVMTGILLVRKIILWFFIIISPVFPLLIFYKPIRNTAKIWVGEFFRWLLYAPLFAIFLHGLVVVWQSNKSIPLAFDYSKVGSVVYPTAINILLGGPGQTIFYRSAGESNSVNLADTFALYVVALLMLWVVIILPFILLKIFLDYISTVSFGSNLAIRQFMTKNLGFLNPPPPKGAGPISPTPPPTPPGSAAPAGVARTLPYLSHKGAATVPLQLRSEVRESVRESTEVLKLANLSIPKMRDIARYETSLMSRDASRRNEVSQVKSALTRIANPTIATVQTDREKFTTVRQQLLQQQQKGNPIAASILNASQVSTAAPKSVFSSILNASQVSTTLSRQDQITNINQALAKLANPAAITSVAEKERFTKIKEQLMAEKQKGNELAGQILDASEKITKVDVKEDEKTKARSAVLDQLLDKEKREQQVITTGTRAPTLPTVNRIQQVSLEDYEEVRKLWSENYQTIEPPVGLSGEQVERREWIKGDIDKITQAITLLNSPDPDKINQGMEMVAGILPFLLIGGFSRSEVVAYLRAKMEAGKQVLTDLAKKEEEEETMVGAQKEKKEESLAATVEEPLVEAPPKAGEKPLEDLDEKKNQ